MKKTYINPEMVIYNIEIHQLMAGSVTESMRGDIKDDFTQYGREFDFEDEE